MNMKGWYGEKTRHKLSRLGIKSGRKYHIKQIITKSNPISYRRAGWTDAKIKKDLKTKKIYVVTKDIGRPKHHYIKMFYYGKKKRGVLVMTTSHAYKRR
jgi:hypothetical protein